MVSGLVLLLAFAWLRLVWYPGLLFTGLDVGGLLVVVLVVDLLLGPLCTLVVYQPGKPSLRFDMAVIFALQLSALGYGLHTFSEGRPAYLVFNVDRFTVVTASELDEELATSEKGAEQWYPLPLMGPRLVGARLPEESEALNALTFESISGGRDLAQMPQYYLPYEQLSGDALKRARDLSEVGLKDKSDMAELEALLTQYTLELSEVGYLPVQARRQDYIAIISKRDGGIAGYLDVTPPW